MPNYLGQHFLKNKPAIHKIIAAIDVQSGETIIEIGPGHGELTLPLHDVCEKAGAKLIAIEKDRELTAALLTKLPDLEIINDDALTALAAKTSGLPSYKILGNIPYYITGHLFRTISELENKPARSVFMIQKEVAERICANPPKMNRLAASVQFWADPKNIMSLGKADFSPAPKVDSALIQLETKHPQPKNPKNYYAAVRTLFAQPRKTILNNLANGEKEKTVQLLASINIDPKIRPQNLTIENIKAIAEACA